MHVASSPEAPDWEPEPDLYWEPDSDLYPEGWEPDPDPYRKPEPEDLWQDQALSWLLPGPRAMSPDPAEPGRFTYGNPTAEALANFIYGLVSDEFGEWFAMAMAGALFLRQWTAEHQGMPPPLLRRAFLVLIAVLRALSPEPIQPGRADHAVIRGPTAPLVRAHAILTSAPPSSRAPVLAGALA